MEMQARKPRLRFINASSLRVVGCLVVEAVGDLVPDDHAHGAVVEVAWHAAREERALQDAGGERWTNGA